MVRYHKPQMTYSEKIDFRDQGGHTKELKKHSGSRYTFLRISVTSQVKVYALAYKV